jgi:hypothetical protein
MKFYKPYNKSEILETFAKLQIVKTEHNMVNTIFNGRLINTTNVSNRYEIFDISTYIKEKLNCIEENFKINEYYLSIKGGVQSLELVSDKIEINDIIFKKTFYILNSSNKSRALNFSLGLKSDNFYMVGNNMSMYKKHLTGITMEAQVVTGDLKVESFDEQIESIKELVGHKIKFSKLREILIGDDLDNIPKVNHRRFDAFKNSICYTDLYNTLTNEQKRLIRKESEKITYIEQKDDFYMDAFYVFQKYLNIFDGQDPYVVKNETKRIMQITQWAVRNNILDLIGI